MPKPVRIVSLISSATETLYALGLADVVVAVSHECDYPPEVSQQPRATFTYLSASASSALIDREVKQLTTAGRALYGVDRDLLTRLAPDLIITQSQCDVCAVSHEEVTSIVASQSELSHTRVLALNPASVCDVFADVLRIGRATACLAESQALVQSLQQRVAAVQSTVATVTSARPKVACIEWIDPLMIAANWVPELVETAGGVHGMTEVGTYTAYTTWSDLCSYDPDIVIVAPCGFGLERARAESQKLTDQPVWRELQAVKSGRVFAVDGNSYFNRSGPRLVDTIELLAGLLHSGRVSLDRRFANAWCRIGPSAP